MPPAFSDVIVFLGTYVETSRRKRYEAYNRKTRLVVVVVVVPPYAANAQYKPK